MLIMTMAKQKMPLLARFCVRKLQNVNGLTWTRKNIVFSRQTWAIEAKRRWGELLGQGFVLVSKKFYIHQITANHFISLLMQICFIKQ